MEFEPWARDHERFLWILLNTLPWPIIYQRRKSFSQNCLNKTSHPPHKQQRDLTQNIPDSWKSCHHLLSLMRWSGDESLLFLVTCSLCCLSSGVFPAEVWQQLLSERVSGDTALRHGARYNMYHTTQVTHHASHTIRGSNHSQCNNCFLNFMNHWWQPLAPPSSQSYVKSYVL